ncbi:hypothetical protein [Dyadobacter sp. CY323]|uniref:hypothetical protein n=1 Tax=Dyadobacter sp. CY323 TaxID=2907302 RepID=UPI001F166C5D|nr:hypothetical protein [Dyadobacter sp. CY323]MCE6989605.1 hypothetical protein [Dyadobacter sp. CY323]
MKILLASTFSTNLVSVPKVPLRTPREIFTYKNRSRARAELHSPGYNLLNLVAGLSFCYVIFPVLIFLVGYVRWEIALFTCMVMILALYEILSAHLAAAKFSRCFAGIVAELAHVRKYILIIALLTFAWLLFSSIGGVGYPNFDSGIRSSLLWHLTRDDWPVWFSPEYMGAEFGYESDKPYVYYFAYYLPAAVAGKLSGWAEANIVLFFYSYLGVLLAVLLVYFNKTTSGVRSAFFLVAGISLFGGMDYLANFVFDFTMDRSEMWLKPFFYFSNTRNLFWSPQHCLPTWIMIGLLLNRKSMHPVLIRCFPLVVCSLVLWSPLCLLGLIPFLVPVLVEQRSEYLRFSLLNITSCLILLILSSFILSNDFSFPVAFSQTLIPDFWWTYARFLTIELLVGTLLISAGFRNFDRMEKQICIIAGCSLVLIPFLILGTWNDWCIKVSMPSLFVMSVLIASSLEYLWVERKGIFYACFLMFCLMGLTAFEEIAESAAHYQIGFGQPPAIRDFGPGYVVKQQLGRPDAFFFNYLAPSAPIRKNGSAE